MKDLYKVKYILIYLFVAIFAFANDIFYLGIQDQPEPNVKIDGKSMNGIILDLFKNGLKLNVKEVKGDWKETYDLLADGKIGALGLVTKESPSNQKNILFSNQIFSENLYVVSKKEHLRSPYNLKGKNIYALKNNNLIKGYLREFLKTHDIDANIIEVDNLKEYENELYLDSEFTALPIQNKLFIRHLPPVCIGVNSKYQYLIPEINRLLDEKYGLEISKYIKELNLYYQRKRFQEKLTSEESEWLRTKKYLKTAYEDDITLSLYSDSNKEFIGLLPTYADKISNIIDVPIVYERKRINSWNNLLSLLCKNKIDFLAISPTSDNTKKLIFSDNFETIPMFLLQHTRSKNYSIGVLDGGKSTYIAKEFFPYSNIKYYPSTRELFKAFKKDEIGYIITPNPLNEANFNCELNHSSTKITDINLNYAFKKDNLILRNIFDKAISVIGDYERVELLMKVDQDHKRYLLNTLSKQNIYNGALAFILIFSTFITLILIHKIILNKKMEHLLNYDPLTNLYNRVIFNKICNESFEIKGTVAVIDLDNFKNANDNYGHDIGDVILIEVGKILLQSFGKESSFRISGDEFYIFENNNFIDKLDIFLNLCKKSDILKKYNITISLGYYKKIKNEYMKDAFKKADLAMYESKKIKGFSCTESI